MYKWDLDFVTSGLICMQIEIANIQIIIVCVCILIVTNTGPITKKIVILYIPSTLESGCLIIDSLKMYCKTNKYNICWTHMFAHVPYIIVY